jgi:hypothetical protein
MTPELDIHDHMRELTEQHSHREPYVLDGETRTLHHWTKVPALVHQLEGARDVLGSEGEQGGRGAPTSKPATRLEAIDMLALIRRESNVWLVFLGLTATPPDTINRLSRLHGLYPSTEVCSPEKDKHTGSCCQRGQLERDVKSWWHQARIVTGWDMPAFKPRGATCPVCEKKGTLRVKVDGALCVDSDCRTIWDATEVGLLAEHIRVEQEKGDAAQDEEGRLASA